MAEEVPFSAEDYLVDELSNYRKAIQENREERRLLIDGADRVIRQLSALGWSAPQIARIAKVSKQAIHLALKKEPV